MNCAEFQKVLPYIIDTGGNAEEEEHLKSCPVCSDLVADLRYIAEQAKLLVPMVEPRPEVWDGIHSSLEREGLVRPARGTGRFPAPIAVPAPSTSRSVTGLLALAVLLLVAIGLITYQGARKNAAQQQASTQLSNSAPAVTALSVDDQNLLQQIGSRSPSMRAAYAEGLLSVNTYIADAKRAVADNPTDASVRAHLISAYDQKAMLYKMALSRSLQ